MPAFKKPILISAQMDCSDSNRDATERSLDTLTATIVLPSKGQASSGRKAGHFPVPHSRLIAATYSYTAY
ncbi:unnamed protein product [Protopolystoma xenopodis]|uniref:Uncharacterized protein n=1 Tax=Protopolystoma xenopodis TaxID=117903 RepID=A0A448XEP3_9PLAT|nr:unnamed protein product [Protopolystoma xenopodis]